MKRWLLALLLVLAPRAVSAQGRFALVMVTDSTRAKVSQYWREHYTRPGAPEAIGCFATQLHKYTDLSGRDTVVVPVAVDFRLVAPVRADWMSTEWPELGCTHAEIPMHFHTPSTCDVDSVGVLVPGSCRLGGPLAFECYPSDSDLQFLAFGNWLINAVVCDERAIVFYQADPPTAPGGPGPPTKPGTGGAPPAKP